MEILVDIIYAISFIAWGYCLIKYRRNVKSWTWNFLWAEKYLGNGWTYIVMILIWLFMMFFWVLYPFGGMELLTWEDTKVQIAP